MYNLWTRAGGEGQREGGVGAGRKGEKFGGGNGDICNSVNNKNKIK